MPRWCTANAGSVPVENVKRNLHPRDPSLRQVRESLWVWSQHAQMYDIGEHLGEKFLTMELIDGAPLSQVLGVEEGNPHALPVARALPIVIEICAGLSAAHEVGIIHRESISRRNGRSVHSSSSAV